MGVDQTRSLELAKNRSLFRLLLFQTFYPVVLLLSDLRQRKIVSFLQAEFRTTRALAFRGVRRRTSLGG